MCTYIYIYFNLKSTLRIDAVEPRDVKDFSRSEAAGPDLDCIERSASVAAERSLRDAEREERRREKEGDWSWRPPTPQGPSLQANALVG